MVCPVTASTVGRTVVSSTDPSTKKSKNASTYASGMLALICSRASSFESGSKGSSRPRTSLRIATRSAARCALGPVIRYARVSGSSASRHTAPTAAMSRGSLVAMGTSENASLIGAPDSICGSHRSAFDMKLFGRRKVAGIPDCSRARSDADVIRSDRVRQVAARSRATRQQRHPRHPGGPQLTNQARIVITAQEEDPVDAGERGAKGPRSVEIAGEDLNVPIERCSTVPDDRTQRVPTLEQNRDQLGSDMAGRAGDEESHC